ncbi:hypothetical protein BT96DRAFT_837389, partial [Gymnopus androsaceus JB14]
ESQLKEQKGNKGDWTYSGPYIIHQKRDHRLYVLRELNGTIMKRHVNTQRLRLFFFRPDNQTLKSRLPTCLKPKEAAVNTVELEDALKRDEIASNSYTLSSFAASVKIYSSQYGSKWEPISDEIFWMRGYASE